MPVLIPVADPADPRLDSYRDIRERDLKGRQKIFVAEGKLVLGHLLAGGRFAPESLLLLESRVAAMAPLLETAPADLPVFVVPPPVMDGVAGFPVHRGILGIGHRREADTAEGLLASLPPRALLMACVGIANHDNIGAIFRNAAAFGADAVLLDPTCCDPLYRKAIRVSVGAALRVPFAVAPGAAALVDLLEAYGFSALALSPGGRTDLRDVIRSPRIALVLGAEGPGLPADLLARLATLRIPMAPGWDSLNVATAAALALHHLADPSVLQPTDAR